MKKQTRARAGYSTLESLAALLVLLLLMGLVVTGISAAVRVYRQSAALSEAQTLSSTLFQALSDELRLARDIRTGSGNVLSSYDSAAYGSDVVLESRDGRVLVSGVGLIGERAYTGLEAEAKVTYNAGLFEVEVVVTDPRQEDIQCARAEFSVAPLNP